MILTAIRLNLTLIFLLFCSVAMAQSIEPAPPVAETGDTGEDTILLLVQPVAPVAVEGEHPVDIDFRVAGQRQPSGEQEGVPDLGDIRLHSIARAVSVHNGDRVVQVRVSEIERGGNLVPVHGFGSTWPVSNEDDLVLSLGESVEIEGDRQALANALAALDEAAASTGGDEGAPINVEASGSTAAEGTAGGSGEASDGAASQYSQPAPVEAAAEPVIETRETRNGCSPRVDLALRVAIDRIRDETYSDGKLTDTGDCYDSYHEEDKYPLERDYSGCSVKVDLGSQRATARFKWFYRNGDNSRIDVASGGSACVDDATRVYKITEDHADCRIDLDFTSLTATPQSRLVYEGGDGVAVEVRACAPSTSRQPVPLVLNASQCPQPETGQQMAAYTYTLDGVVHPASVCAPSGASISVRTDYDDCQVRVDRTLGVAFRQVRDLTVQDGETTGKSECYDSYAAGDRYRLERDYAACGIETDLAARTAASRFELHYNDADGNRVVVDECAVDPDRALVIFEAHDCSILHEGGKAILQSRLVYQTRDGTRHQVRDCSPSEDPARAPIPMTFNTDICGNPDGSAAARRFNEQGRYEYALDGVTRTHGTCRDTGRRIEYRADYDCSLAFDVPAERVFRRFRIETIIDGEKTATSACMQSDADPGNVRLVRDYEECSDIVDLNGMRKTYRFRYSYTDADGITQAYGRCREASDRSFALIEDFEACSTAHDLKAMTATPQSRLVYEGGDGATVEVRACAKSVTKTVATITEEHDGCALAFEAGRAIPQARLVYTSSDGARVEARGCAASASRTAIAMEFNTERCVNREPSADIPFNAAGVFKYDEMGVYEYELDGETRTRGTCRTTGREIEFSRRLSCEGGYGDGHFDYQRMRMSTRFGIGVIAKEKGTGSVLEIIETFHGPCFTSDGFRSWPITIDYDSKHCPDRTDYTTMRYTPRGYVLAMRPAGEGGPVLGDPNCRDGRTYALTEDHEVCNVDIDTTGGKARFQSRLVYTDEDGAVQVARACQESETREAVDLVRNTDLCTVRPGNADGVFKERARWTYTLGDTVHPVGTCEDTGITWEYRTVHEGCDIRLDHKVKAAFRQVKKQTFKDGTKISETACADSADAADRFAFERSYTSCEIATDLKTLVATTYFKWIYTDQQGRQHIATGAAGADDNDCVADANRTYAITEDHDSCTHYIDYNELTVTPQARLVYRTPDGRDHQVRECGTSVSREAVDLVNTTERCTKEHDLAAGKSWQQSMYVYSIGGLTYQAKSCSRTETSWPHEKHYGDCAPVVDRNNSLVTRQYQTRIKVDGAYEYVVSSCTADPDSSRLPIKSTTNGCNDPEFWIHDLSAGISYGLHRLYYTEPGSNVRIFVTPACVASTATYEHDVETVGYQNHDDGKFGYALSKVSISTDDGPFVIRESEVLPGSPQIDYIKARTVDLPPTARKAGDRTYEGCKAFDRTDRTEFWTRPDGSEASYVTGDGDPVETADVCRWVVSGWSLLTAPPNAPTRRVVNCGPRTCASYSGDGSTCYDYRYSHRQAHATGTYQARRRNTREDGTVLSTVTKTRSHTISGPCSYGSGAAVSDLPNPMNDNTIVNRWLVELGWN